MFRTLAAAKALRAWNAFFGGAGVQGSLARQQLIATQASARSSWPRQDLARQGLEQQGLALPDASQQALTRQNSVLQPDAAQIGLRQIELMQTDMAQADAGRQRVSAGALLGGPDGLAMLGHELRTPLAALMGYTEMLAGADQLTDAQRRSWSASAYAAASHLNAIVASVLEGGVGGLGALSADRETVDLCALASGCCDFVRPDAAARGVSLFAPAQIPDVALSCDPRAMRQILLNLLSNAVKFTPPGGEVHVRAEIDGGMIALVVTDTGIGMEAARQRQLTAQPQAHASGLGLGLPLVRSLAALHGGHIQIHAGERSGTVARVMLPAGLPVPSKETSAGPTSASHMMVPCLA